jgi:hypothetical protein
MDDRKEHPGDDRRPRARAAGPVVPVICDRCRVAGTAGTGDFSHLGDLLEFEPVPRPVKRVDGWSEEKQRAFIALLATTGNQRRASMALGMAPYGASKLREAPGADSFNAAWDRAMAIAAKNGTMKISTAVADAAARAAQLAPQPSRLRGHEPDGDAEQQMDVDAKLQLIESLFYRWLGKVEQERTARLKGEVVAADFYLRQVTFFEITFDLMCSGLGQDAWSVMSGLRRGGHHIIHIAATPMSRILDEKRRELWEKMGEPDRPEFPPARYLLPKLDFSLEPLEYAQSGEEGRSLKAEYARRHEEDAAEQLAWETGAHAVRGSDEA